MFSLEISNTTLRNIVITMISIGVLILFITGAYYTIMLLISNIKDKGFFLLTAMLCVLLIFLLSASFMFIYTILEAWNIFKVIIV